MRKLLLFNILFFGCFSCINAQDIKVSGVVKQQGSGEAISASLIVFDAKDSGQILTYCLTDEAGAFSFAVRKKYILVSVSAIGYKATTLTLFTDTIRTLVIQMEEQAREMQEVIVRAQKRKDTTDLMIDSMNLTDQSTLRDILYKTQGVVVSKEGSISVDGKPVNKILINGKEVFIQQNKIALDNLNYELMEKVQIINNYKDRFTLDFNSNAETVINVNTKEKFKNVFKVVGEAGMGYRNAYRFKARAFRFSESFNLFSTSNINNISEKELSFKDIPDNLIKKNTADFRNSILPFFTPDNLFERDLNLSNSITLRSQTSKIKASAVITQSYINTKQRKLVSLSKKDTVLQEQNQVRNNNGSFLTAQINTSQLFNRRIVLNNSLVAGAMKLRDDTKINTNSFTPPIGSLAQMDINNPDAFSLANTLKITNVINTKTITNLYVDFFGEKFNNFLNANLSDFLATSSVIQRQQMSKRSIAAVLDMRRKISNMLYLRIGSNGTSMYDQGEIGNTADRISKRRRSVYTYGALIETAGENQRIAYALSAEPTAFIIQSDAGGDRQVAFKTNSFINYRLKGSGTRNLLFRFDRNILLPDVINSFDTVVKAFNYKTVGSRSNSLVIQMNQRADMGYYYSNLITSISYYADFSQEKTSYALQDVFDTLLTNVFYYKNITTNSQTRHSLRTGFSKGIYISKRYDRLIFRTEAVAARNAYSFLLKNNLEKINNMQFQTTTEIRLEPRYSFLSEAKIGFKLVRDQFNVNNTTANRALTLQYYISAIGSHKKIDWRFYAENYELKIPGRNFRTPNVDVSIRYKQNEQISFAVNGKSLVNLFNLNPNANLNLNTIQRGDLITQTMNASLIGYLTLNLIYKF